MKLEVGKYYKNRDGEVVMIVKYECQEDEEFYRCKYRTYTPQGSYYAIGESDYDLIEEVCPCPRLQSESGTDRYAGLYQINGR